MLFTAAEQKRAWLCWHRKGLAIIHLSFLICNSSEGHVSPGRAPSRSGEHADRQEEPVGHVSQGQGRENRESLGMSYVTESLSWPCRPFWTQSPSNTESTSSALPRWTARSLWSIAASMSTTPWWVGARDPGRCGKHLALLCSSASPSVVFTLPPEAPAGEEPHPPELAGFGPEFFPLKYADGRTGKTSKSLFSAPGL